MTCSLTTISLHVPNVWQTCRWYYQVFGFPATLSSDASAARLHVAGLKLLFAAHATQEEVFGARRLHSFLQNSPAFHLTITMPDVQAAFDHALTHGAVPIREPFADEAGSLQAILRDLNGLLIHLSQTDNSK